MSVLVNTRVLLAASVQRADLFFSFAIILLFLFSNLIDRIMPIGASAAFYALTGLAFLLHVLSAKLQKWQLAVIGVAAYFSIFPLVKGEHILVAVAAAKDLSLPIAGILLGYLLLSRQQSFDILNRLYLPFVAYGLLQAWAFNSESLATLLPWDDAYVRKMISAGLSVYQTNDLRLFGTLNSFFHYQLIAVVVPVLLWIYRDRVSQRRLLALNTVFMLILIIVLRERTPVAVLGLISIVFILGGKGRIRIAGCYGLAVVFALAFIISSNGRAAELIESVASPFGRATEINESDTKLRNESDADLRMANMLMLRVDSDTSSRARMAIWREMLEYITPANILFGRSPGELLPGYETWCEGKHLSPHNVYLFFVLAYGLLGLAIFFLLVLNLVVSCCVERSLSDEKRLFLVALTLGYLLIGMFHLSFVSKFGFLFCWILGVSLAERDAGKVPITQVGY